MYHRKKIEHFFAIMEKELGGEEAFMDKYIGLYAEKLAEKKFNSTILCFTFDK